MIDMRCGAIRDNKLLSCGICFSVIHEDLVVYENDLIPTAPPAEKRENDDDDFAGEAADKRQKLNYDPTEVFASANTELVKMAETITQNSLQIERTRRSVDEHYSSLIESLQKTRAQLLERLNPKTYTTTSLHRIETMIDRVQMCNTPWLFQKNKNSVMILRTDLDALREFVSEQTMPDLTIDWDALNETNPALQWSIEDRLIVSGFRFGRVQNEQPYIQRTSSTFKDSKQLAKSHDEMSLFVLTRISSVYSSGGDFVFSLLLFCNKTLSDTSKDFCYLDQSLYAVANKSVTIIDENVPRRSYIRAQMQSISCSEPNVLLGLTYARPTVVIRSFNIRNRHASIVISDGSTWDTHSTDCVRIVGTWRNHIRVYSDQKLVYYTREPNQQHYDPPQDLNLKNPAYEHSIAWWPNYKHFAVSFVKKPATFSLFRAAEENFTYIFDKHFRLVRRIPKIGHVCVFRDSLLILAPNESTLYVYK